MTPPPPEPHPRLSLGSGSGSVPHRGALAALVAVTVACAGVLFASGGTPAPAPEMWFWLAACVAGELMWVTLPLDRATLSMAACFQFAAALCLGRADAMLATALSVLIAEIAFVRKPFVRALYNAAQCAVAVGAAAWVLRALAGPGTVIELLGGFRLLPFAAAAAAYSAVNRGAVTLAVALSRDLRIGVAWRENFGGRFDPFACSAVLALGVIVAVSRQQLGLVATLFVLLPLHLVCAGYRREFESRVRPQDPHEIRAAA